MDDVLSEVAGKLELSNEGVGLAQLARQVKLLELALLVKDSIDLYGEDLVPFLFAIEIFGALGGAVYDLGDLPKEAGAGDASVMAAAFGQQSASRDGCTPCSGQRSPDRPLSRMAQGGNISSWHAGPRCHRAGAGRSPHPSYWAKRDAGPSGAITSSEGEHEHVRFHGVDGWICGKCSAPDGRVVGT